MHVPGLQAEADVAQVEPVQRHSLKMEGEDTTQQCHLAVLAHAVHSQAKYVGVSVRLSPGRGHTQQTRSRGVGGQVLEEEARSCDRRVQKMAHVPTKSDSGLCQGRLRYVWRCGHARLAARQQRFLINDVDDG